MKLRGHEFEGVGRVVWEGIEEEKGREKHCSQTKTSKTGEEG